MFSLELDVQVWIHPSDTELEPPFRFTVPFQSIQQSCITGLFFSLKCQRSWPFWPSAEKNKDRNKNICPRFQEILLYQPKKGWCHGHFWHLLKPKIQQACHGSQGLLNWLKWDSMFNGLAEFYFEHYVWFTGRFKHCSWGSESDHV